MTAHYKENGTWKDIDNNLVEGKDEENNGVLVNKNNSYKVEFGKTSDAKKLVSIKKDGYEVSWNINTPNDSANNILSEDIAISENSTSTTEPNVVAPAGSEVQEKVPVEETTNLVNTTESQVVQESTVTQTVNSNLLKAVNTTSAQVKPKNTDYLSKLSEDDRKTTLTNLTSTVDFKNIYENVDLEYEVRPEDIKETIIINKKIDNAYFEFNINAKNLTAKLQADKSIIFYDAKDSSKEVFAMDAPYMIDAKHQQSTDIEVGFTQTKTGYILSLKPNKQWLDSSERSYPIKVDPTLTTDLGISSIQDTYVSSSQPGAIYYTNTILKTGYNAATGNTRTYMKFILPTLTSTDMVTSAKLLVSLATAGTTASQVNAYRPSANWSPESLTWTNQPAFAPTAVVEDFQMVQNVNTYSWDVTAATKDWYNTGNNYGVMLQHKNEGSSSGYNEFLSSDNSNLGIRPRITIQYVNNSGFEDYWTYHSQSVGRAGTGFVNDYLC